MTAPTENPSQLLTRTACWWPWQRWEDAVKMLALYHSHKHGETGGLPLNTWGYIGYIGYVSICKPSIWSVANLAEFLMGAGQRISRTWIHQGKRLSNRWDVLLSRIRRWLRADSSLNNPAFPKALRGRQSGRLSAHIGGRSPIRHHFVQYYLETMTQASRVAKWGSSMRWTWRSAIWAHTT